MTGLYAFAALFFLLGLFAVFNGVLGYYISGHPALLLLTLFGLHPIWMFFKVLKDIEEIKDEHDRSN